MSVERRPFVIVKQIRAVDVRAGDVIRWSDHDWMTVDDDDWGTGFFATRGALVDIQVLESGLVREEPDDPPPVPVVADPAYTDSLRGGNPRSGLPTKRSS